MSNQLTDSCKSWGPLALRIVTGAIFVIAGMSKLQGIDGFATGLAATIYPAAIALLLAWIVALVELIAGAMLVLGIKTNKAAMPLKIIIIFAVITKFFGGFGGASWNSLRLDLLLIAALSVLVGYKGGKWSVLDKNTPTSVTVSSKEAAAKDDSSEKKKKSSSKKKKSSSKKSSSKKSKKSSKKKSSSKKKDKK